MSEFLEGGNQTADQSQQATPETTPNTDHVEGGQQQETSTSEYDVIKYNKEEVQLPADKRQDYLQKGYFWEQKGQAELEALKEQNAYIDRMAAITGYTSKEELFAAIAEQEQQARIAEEAERAGMTPEQYQQYLEPVNSQLSELQQKLQKYEQDEMVRTVQAEEMALANKYEDFNDYRDSAFQIAIDKGYNLEDAYILASHADKVEKTRLAAQQQAIQSLSSKQQNSVGSLSGGDGGHKSTVSSLSKSDFEAMKQAVLRGDKKQL